MKRLYDKTPLWIYVLILIIIIILPLLFSVSLSSSNFFSSYFNIIKEGFEWDNETTCKYETYIKYYNPTYRFNIDIMKQNATEDEINYLLKNNEYPWNDRTKEIFLDTVSKNNTIRTDPYNSLKESQNVYPERTILQKLGFNTKEGDFLLYGSILPPSKDMPPNIKNIAKCKIGNDGNSYMIKKTYDGLSDPIFQQYKYKYSKVNDDELEKTIPGFNFVNGSTCNPCSVLNDTPNYNCPFTLNKNGDTSISPVWKILWNIEN